ncbi:hypothetical protein BE21_04170 [Sorangium cellulosum]|uniref:Secreted protein n=1 Tax=Sorangium cellulosum TaxID=56 RepID=A0A150TH19_SORCE|nr:hypothetical protein BE21_04170 [Sorangium cellulosum]
MRQSEWTCLAVFAALSTALSCNAIWGISEGEIADDAGMLAAANYPTRILADATFVYWYSDGAKQLQRVRTSGGAPETLADSTYINGLAQDCRAVYWTTWHTEELPASVFKLAK